MLVLVGFKPVTTEDFLVRKSSLRFAFLLTVKGLFFFWIFVSTAGALRGLVKIKKTTFFGNFSQIAETPPTPPFWDILFTKKFLVFILHFRP